MADHMGYDSGHPWYWYLGGAIPTVEDIRKEAEKSARGYLQYEIEKLATKPEPRRSRDIQKMREDVEEGLKRSLKQYSHYCNRVRYRRRWQGPWEDQNMDIWREPNQNACLVHNHLHNAYGNLAHLDQIGRASNEQLTLFLVGSTRD